ncbi:MAG TPA: DnaA N-terminal domain-containing protein, partial [Acidimicrobiales bacterium]|nr:DnaA N-terminal domain-containing protein [Acidimicrobiales bacterium]
MEQLVDTFAVGEAELLVTNAERLWNLCSEALRTQVTEATWRAWFEGVAPLTADNDTLILGVPSTLAKERIEARYLPLMRDLLNDATGVELDVVLEVQPGMALR